MQLLQRHERAGRKTTRYGVGVYHVECAVQHMQRARCVHGLKGVHSKQLTDVQVVNTIATGKYVRVQSRPKQWHGGRRESHSTASGQRTHAVRQCSPGVFHFWCGIDPTDEHVQCRRQNGMSMSMSSRATAIVTRRRGIEQ